MGYEFYVPAKPVRDHVKQLKKFGIGERQLALLANVSYVTIRTLMNGHSSNPGVMTTRITQGAARRLLQIEAKWENLADGAMVDAKPSQRRIQAMCVVGYSLRWQADAIETKFANYQRILKNKKVTRETADKITNLYKRYAFTPNTANDTHGKKAISITKNYARRQGWHGAAAYDDIETKAQMNFPITAVPYEARLRSALRLQGKPKFTEDERLQTITDLKKAGLTFKAIASIMTLSPATVSRTYNKGRKWNPASTEQN